MSEKMNSILEKLRRKTIYQENEISTPEQIYQQSLHLNKLKYVDLQGLFLTSIRNIFIKDYPLDSKIKKKEEIDPNQLISAILAIHRPFDIEKYDVLSKYEIDLLKKTLTGELTDFLDGKKDSNFITPAYVILRSLKERNSYWLLTAFKNMPPDKRKKLRENVEEIIENLSRFIPDDQKQSFLRIFNIDLNWLYQEYNPPKQGKIKLRTLVQEGIGLSSKNTEIIEESQPDFSDKSLKLREKKFSDNEQEVFDTYLHNLKIDKNNYVLDENSSSNKESTFYQLLNQGLKKLNDQIVLDDLETAFDNDYQNPLSFSNLNKQLAIVLYKITHKESYQPSDQQLVNFLDEEKTTILMTLKKIFLIKNFVRFYQQKKDNNSKSEKVFELHPNLDFKLEQLKNKGIDQKINIRLIYAEYLSGLQEKDLLSFILAFNIEKYLTDKKNEFPFSIITNQEGNIMLSLEKKPNIFFKSEDGTIGFFYQGWLFPIKLEFNQKTNRLNISFFASKKQSTKEEPNVIEIGSIKLK